MKLWVFSDLHLEFDNFRKPLRPRDFPDADVCVVAGDILNGCANSIEWLADEVAPVMPVIFVAGNHEFYGDSIFEGLEWGRQAAAKHPDVHFLENGSVVIDGVRFLGCTLWTDFALDGRAPREIAWAAATFEGRLNDTRQIAWRRLPAYEAFTAKRAQELHASSRAFLRREMPFDGQTVVVTHHAPHPRSVHPKYKGGSLNPSFASDLGEMMELWRPALWIHGHVHDSFDYRVRDTRVVCNPCGYGNENPAFDPGLVVEI